MRKPGFLSLAAAALAALGAATLTTSADAHYRRAPAGWGEVREVVHYGYYPRYHHVYRTHWATDPYAYRYEPRGYYPYYNSAYWQPAYKVRGRNRAGYIHPPYYQAWGYPVRNYNHVEWHYAHHGRHHWGHW